MILPLVFYSVTFIFGLFFGSFLNVVADRVINGKPIVKGRSECDHCKKKLASNDLIPLLSYFMNGGKCVHCKKKISVWYPVSELLAGGLFFAVAYWLDLASDINMLWVWILFIYLLFVSSAYIVLFLTDAKYGYLPNKIVNPTIVVVVLFNLFHLVSRITTSYSNLAKDPFGKYLIEAGYFQDQAIRLGKEYLLTILVAIIIGLFFYMLTKIKNGQAMGGGDVKLALLIGLFNHFPANVLAIFLGFFFGAAYSIILMATGKKNMKDTVPFGPFLILGSLVALFFGSQILSWYIGLI